MFAVDAERRAVAPPRNGAGGTNRRRQDIGDDVETIGVILAGATRVFAKHVHTRARRRIASPMRAGVSVGSDHTRLDNDAMLTGARGARPREPRTEDRRARRGFERRLEGHLADALCSVRDYVTVEDVELCEFIPGASWSLSQAAVVDRPRQNMPALVWRSCASGWARRPRRHDAPRRAGEVQQ